MANGDLTLVLDERDYQALQSMIQGLSNADQGHIIQSALKQGMEVIIAQGKANLRARNKKRKGNLSRSFGISVNKKRKASYGGFRRPQGSAAHLVDRGTNERWTKKGYYRGSVSKGKPNVGSAFFSDAVDSRGEEAINRLMTAIYDEINRIMK